MLISNKVEILKHSLKDYEVDFSLTRYMENTFEICDPGHYSVYLYRGNDYKLESDNNRFKLTIQGYLFDAKIVEISQSPWDLAGAAIFFVTDSRIIPFVKPEHVGAVKGYDVYVEEERISDN